MRRTACPWPRSGCAGANRVRLPDTLTGGAFTALGVFLVAQGWAFPRDFGLAGPGLFPMVVGSVMALAGLTVVLSGLRRRAGAMEPDPALAALRRPRVLVALLMVPAGIAFYALAAPTLGAGLVGAVVVAAMALAWRRPPLQSVLLGLGAAIVFHVLFAIVLRVPLPHGVLEALLP